MPALEKPLHIDIPVTLTEVKVAFSVPALAFEGDLPASIFHLQLIENDIADWNAKAQVIAVFHTNAGHVTLNDKAYNTERNVATGNPYKDLVSDLMKRGVHFELCGSPGLSTAARYSREKYSDGGRYRPPYENESRRWVSDSARCLARSCRT